MKKNVKGMFAAILILCGTMLFSSCEKYAETFVEGLFMGNLNAQKEKDKQHNLNNLLNWVAGQKTTQEAIDTYGLPNCFTVTELPIQFGNGEDAMAISPNVNVNDLCYVRCLFYSPDRPGCSVPRISGVVCNKRIAQDLVYIFRQLYDAKYPCVHSNDTQRIDKEKLLRFNYTYSYYFDQQAPEQATMAQQQGLAIVLNGNEAPTSSNDLAVRLFKEKGFKWGGDEPDGDRSYFEYGL